MQERDKDGNVGENVRDRWMQGSDDIEMGSVLSAT